MLSAEISLMRNPRAYAHLVELPERPGSAWRRPLLVASVLGCAISLMTSGRITLRLAAPATLYWSFLPLCEILALGVFWIGGRPGVPFRRAIDLLFAGQAPCSLWLLAFAAVWACFPAPTILAVSPRPWMWYVSAIGVLGWTAWIDFWFFRCVLARSPARALASLLLYRAICWPLALAVFLYSAGVTVVAKRLGL